MEKPSLDTAKAGAMRFNTDLSQLEIYDGNQWTGILATSGELQTGGTRGVFHGGGDPADPTLDVMDFITISTTGDATDFGDLSSNRRNHRGNASRIRNFAGGGYSDSAGAVRNTVEAAFAQKMRDAILQGKITKWNKANPKASQEEFNKWLSGAMKEVSSITDEKALKMGKR